MRSSMEGAIPLVAAARICEDIRQMGYGRDPLGPRLDCWGCLQSGGGNALVAPERTARCKRVVARYHELAAQGKVGWL